MFFGKSTRFSNHEENGKTISSEICPPISHLSLRGPKMVDDWHQPRASTVQSIMDAAVEETGQPLESVKIEKDSLCESTAAVSAALGRKTIFDIDEKIPGAGEYDLSNAKLEHTGTVTLNPPVSTSRKSKVLANSNNDDQIGPGYYQTNTSLLKPSFNKRIEGDASLLIPHKEKVQAEQLEKDYLLHPKHLHNQRSTVEERREMKADMRSLLQKVPSQRQNCDALEVFTKENYNEQMRLQLEVRFLPRGSVNSSTFSSRQPSRQSGRPLAGNDSCASLAADLPITFVDESAVLSAAVAPADE
mmetsp:Transcript_31813/g.53673  ORF Transcript_31813/g.53673 Transcript_31813/m.53673 type:complete len:302 (-) Transcript_31813:173-1078(-)